MRHKQQRREFVALALVSVLVSACSSVEERSGVDDGGDAGASLINVAPAPKVPPLLSVAAASARADGEDIDLVGGVWRGQRVGSFEKVQWTETAARRPTVLAWNTESRPQTLVAQYFGAVDKTTGVPQSGGRTLLDCVDPRPDALDPECRVSFSDGRWRLNFPVPPPPGSFVIIQGIWDSATEDESLANEITWGFRVPS